MVPIPPSEENKFVVRMGIVASVDIYQIKENELEALEHGTQGGTYLNFSIFLLSTAITTIVSLCTAKFESHRIETVFIVFSIVGLVLGVLLLVLWWKAHKSLSDVIRKIRDRIPSDNTAPAEPPSPPTK